MGSHNKLNRFEFRNADKTIWFGYFSTNQKSPNGAAKCDQVTVHFLDEFMQSHDRKRYSDRKKMYRTNALKWKWHFHKCPIFHSELKLFHKFFSSFSLNFQFKHLLEMHATIDKYSIQKLLQWTIRSECLMSECVTKASVLETEHCLLIHLELILLNE